MHRQNAQNLPRKFVQKKFPTPPFRGAGGKVFGVLTAARPSANIRDKPRPHGPGPANRRHPGGVQKGEVNLKTPNVAELLVQQTEKATRLEVENEQLRAEIDRLKAEIDRLNRQQ